MRNLSALHANSSHQNARIFGVELVIKHVGERLAALVARNLSALHADVRLLATTESDGNKTCLSFVA